MKLVVERSALMTALTHANSVVERRSTIPVLANVRLDADEQNLRLTATDMDLEVVQNVAADVSASGTTTASAFLLQNICRTLPDGAQVALERDQVSGRLSIHCGPTQFEFACLPPEDFPLMTATAFSHGFSLPAVELRRLLDRTHFAALVEGARENLQGVFFHATSGDSSPALRAVATDGHRLARVDTEQPEGADGMPGIIVPNKTIHVLRSLIDTADEDIDIEVAERKMSFRSGTIQMTSKLIDGTYPNYEKVIPDDNDRVMKVSKDTFVRATDRMSVITTTDKGRPVKLDISTGRLQVSASNLEGVTGEEELEVDYEGPPMTIGFNARYISEMAKNFDGDVMLVVMSRDSSPAIVRDADDNWTLYVLMPLRV